MRNSRKGVILAGGSGTRLRPLTLIMNKHLLPIYDRPMIMYPLETLKGAGISNICVVTGESDLSSFKKYMGDGKQFGVSITYKTQTGPLGLADAVLKAEDFFAGSKVVAILGDDIFTKTDIPDHVFEDEYAYVFLNKAKEPTKVAIPVLDSNGRIVKIEEKPKVPKSDFMIPGLYVYPPGVFDVIRKLKPSQRGELEITDVNNWYVDRKLLKAIKIDSFVMDAGTPEALLRAGIIRAKELGVRI